MMRCPAFFFAVEVPVTQRAEPQALGVDLVYPNTAPPSRIRDTVRKYWSGALRGEQLPLYGLEETAYEDMDASRCGKDLKHLRLSVPALQAWFEPGRLGCRQIHGYADVFAEDGALVHLARTARLGAIRKARLKLGESLQLRESDLRNQTGSVGFDGHHHMAMAIKGCWEQLGELVSQAETAVHRS
eukprot:133578-Rhodomonas_salina.1